MSRIDQSRVTFEGSAPVFRVENMQAAIRYYVDVLGFKAAEWSTDEFASVSRDSAGIYLCKGGQGAGKAWAWVGVEDAAKLHEEYKATGAKIRLAPTKYSWALEMQIEDPDGNVLRLGSDPQ
jgi:catechol 2,3-dioxygenase-like lactoylglutathione lyase family enzyme